MAKLPFDPEQLPVDSVGGEAPLDASRLTADWLRSHFAAPPDWHPEALDESLVQREVMIAAAVLIPLVARAGGLTMLLTQRTDHLSSHAGQISFPGGRAETYDASPVATALREAQEEIGLDARHAEIIGQLPIYLTGTGYRVTPVVALLTPPFELLPDPQEVAEIFEVPLAHLMNGAHHQRLSVDLPSGRRSFYAMPYERHFIWGATAGMLRNLFHFLRA
ncbi:CoA pyrophosphatase [Massilia eurypsychrophila]|uniref:CoA pyrophosphatase n=1 Tax=Massilia eurypsychrophila TaxID=1485217 RepID=A0A2G8TAI4_9BURK|nr:CoA pyrophosphatase [Massilia eurypsychrophila]PIL43067.1 CoA pyrophosphatase [Massilia eurypsychrophila]